MTALNSIVPLRLGQMGVVESQIVSIFKSRNERLRKLALRISTAEDGTSRHATPRPQTGRNSLCIDLMILDIIQRLVTIWEMLPDKGFKGICSLLLLLCSLLLLLHSFLHRRKQSVRVSGIGVTVR